MAAPPATLPFALQSVATYAAKLPPAPRVFGRLVAAINDGNSSLDRMAELVRLDAAITSQLLRLANSALFGFRTQASNVEEAVLRVGLKELHRIVGLCSASLVFQADLALYATDAERVWSNAVATAVAMEQITGWTGGDPALAYTAGLLRSIGKMVLARHAAAAAPAPYSEGGPPLPAWEAALFGCNHAQVGATLCEFWRFPRGISGALRDHLCPAANPSALALAHQLNLAGSIATALECGLPGESTLWANDPARFEKTGLREDQLAEITMGTVAELDRMTTMLECIRGTR
jgi:HD-like signal output (HDOD) protein